MKKLLTLIVIFLSLSLLVSCGSFTNTTTDTNTTTVKNAPRLINIYAENFSELSYKSSSLYNVNLSTETENVVIGQSPTIVIICENIEKDSFVDVEVYDSYYPDNIFLYSGDSVEYSARASTLMDINTEIWTTAIKIKLPTFESFEDRTVTIRKINFLREVINENVEAVIGDDVIDTLTFNVDSKIPMSFNNEILYYEFMLRYEMLDTSDSLLKEELNIPEELNQALRLVIFSFDDTPAYGETKIIDLPRYNSAYYMVPSDLAGYQIDWLLLYINNTRINFVMTTLDYKVLEIGGFNDNSDFTLYCTFDSQDIFNGQTAEDIFSILNDSGYQIVYNFDLNE